MSSVTVANQDDQWMLVSLGNPNLTKDLVEARKTSVARTGLAPHEHFVVIVPALYAIFVAHRDEGRRSDEADEVQFTHVLEEGRRPRR